MKMLEEARGKWVGSLNEVVIGATKQQGGTRTSTVTVGGEKTLPQSLMCVRTGGMISIIGVLSGGTMTAQLGRIVMKQARMQGIGVGHRNAFEAMLRAFEQHRIAPVIDKVFKLDEIRAAHERMEKGEQFGKIVIVP